MAFRIPTLKVILINSKVDRNTSRMVQIVKEHRSSLPSVVDNIFDTIDSISTKAIKIFSESQEESNSSSTKVSEEDHHKLQDLCRINNSLLIALGVGHHKVDEISTVLARYGIYPKMTGAGGGGSVFAFIKPETPPTIMKMITDDLAKLDCETWLPSIGEFGVIQHSLKPDIFDSSPVVEHL